MMSSPLEQFQVMYLFCLCQINGCKILFLNIDWAVILIIVAALYFIIIPLRFSFVIPYGVTYFHVYVFNFVVGLITGRARMIQITPYIAMLFYFILISNLQGLLPYGFTVTSQLFVTFTLSVSTFIGVIVVGLFCNKNYFINYFLPSNVPNKALFYFLVFIEILSFLIRPFSLGIRLFANMLAGHTLIYILAGFSFSIAFKFMFLTLIVPFLIIASVMLLEFSIAVIQTYVFIVLSVIYIRDMLDTVH